VYPTIADFESDFTRESGGTRKYMDALTDASLSQAVADDHRTLGRIAWHMITTYPEMMNLTGLTVKAVAAEAPLPETAKEIRETYAAVTRELLDQVKQSWKDEDLLAEDDMYGEQWKRGATLRILVRHEIHHRGQMSILMRQAGLAVPGVYGPSKEEWLEFNMPTPEV
jgi:uncharacterized damage-inducible protein DinB